MDHYRFENGDRMPVLGIGTWKSDPEKLYQAIVAAVEYGYRHIDCAYIYQNEKIVGEALSHLIRNGVVKREELWITSKLWNSCHRRSEALPALERTLGDLGLDYLDLYLVHWPVALKEGVLFPESSADFYSLDQVPIIETWRGMEDCLEAGLTRHIGVSNFSVSKLKALLPEAKYRPEVNQVEMNPYIQQPELVKFCKANNICVTAYSPLGKGDHSRPGSANLYTDPVVTDIASRHRCTPSQVMLRWGIQRGLVVIPKSVTPSRIHENFDAAEITLTDDDMMRLGELDRNNRISYGGVFIMEGGPYTMENIWN